MQPHVFAATASRINGFRTSTLCGLNKLLKYLRQRVFCGLLALL